MTDEKELVAKYRQTYDALDEADKLWDDASKAHNQAKTTLIEHLESKGATSSARYEGLGRVSLMDPQLFASVKKENEEELFSYLHEINRGDLIKNTIHWKTLTGFCKEMSEGGKPVPEYITLSYKKVARLTK